MASDMETSTKRCAVCDQERSLHLFFPSKATTDGLHTSCKTCSKASWRQMAVERDARRDALAQARHK